MRTATITEPAISMRAYAGRSRVQKLKLKKILVPVDFSESSADAANYAVQLSDRLGAELHLIHVYEPATPFLDSMALPVIIPEHRIGARLQRRLREFTNDHQVPASRRKLYTIKGAPFEQICRFAGSLKVDLIVISTRGKAGLAHLVLGSTAERVVRHSPCPVLVLRPKHTKINGNGKPENVLPTFQTILVPIDFSACSMQGLTYAKMLAKEFRSRLVLLHSVHLQYYVSNDEYARYDFGSVMKVTEELACDQMRDLIRDTRAGGIQVESALEVGHPGEQICERAKDRQADLIVTSTHGHTGLKHVFLGSTAEYVVRHAKCPVLVVPTREHQPNEAT